MMVLLNILLPIFLLIGLGAFLQNKGFFGEGFARGLSRLVFWVGIPCLLFDKISGATFALTPVLRILFAFYVAASVAIGTGFLVARGLGLSRLSTGAFVQACYRGNLGFVGLPVVLYAGASLFPGQREELGTLAVLTLAPTAPIYNFVAILLMIGSKEPLRLRTSLALVREIGTNPLVLSACLGLLFAGMGWALPVFLERTVHRLGGITIPLALLCMGAIFIEVPMRGSFQRAFVASLVKVIWVPFVGFGAVLWLGLSPLESCIVLVYLACPTAVASFLFVEQYRGDEELAVNAVVLSTMLSVLPLSFVLWWLQS